jgi:hypothetical protein
MLNFSAGVKSPFLKRFFDALRTKTMEAETEILEEEAKSGKRF